MAEFQSPTAENLAALNAEASPSSGAAAKSPANGISYGCGNCGNCERCKAHQKHMEDEEMSENGYIASWPPWRTHLAKILGNPIFDGVLCCIVFYNLVVVVAETDFNSKHKDEKDASLPWVDVSNNLLITFYTLEITLRFVVYGRHLLKERTNWLDVTIVGFDLIMLPISAIFGDVISLSFLRIFRLVRLGRSWRIMRVSPELSILLKGLLSTARSIFVGSLLIFIMLTVSSILAVEFIQPVNLDVARLTEKYDGCDRCARAFATVMDANLTFFQQLIAGDSWGGVTIPVIEQNPWTAPFFIIVHISIAIGVMNLLLAVIVDRASAARAEDKKSLLREEKHEKKVLGNHLLSVCSALDTDGSRTLSLEELKEGWIENDDFQTTMQAMDVGEEDISAVFNILDSDNSGFVNYEEFVESLWKMKSTDQQTMLIFIKYYVCDIRNKQSHYMKTLENKMLKEYSSLTNILGKLEVDDKKESVQLEKIETEMKCTMNMGQVQPSELVQEAGQAMLDVPEKLPEISSLRSQELVDLRSSNQELSAMVKQCFTQLQQLTHILEQSLAQQVAERPRSSFPQSFWSCSEASKAPIYQSSLLVVPTAATLGPR